MTSKRWLPTLFGVLLSAGSANAQVLTEYYSRNDTHIFTRSARETVSKEITPESPLCSGKWMHLRYVPNPFGKDVDIIGVYIFLQDNKIVGSPFVAFQHGSDWAHMALAKPIPGEPFAQGFLLPAPMRLRADETILEESACHDGVSRSLGVTFFAVPAHPHRADVK